MKNLTPDEILEEIEKIRISNNWLKDEKSQPLNKTEIAALPSIPKDWKWVSIHQLSKFITNGVHTPTSFEDSNGYGLHCLRITDIQNNDDINYDKLPYCLRIVEGDYDKKLKKGDIYFSFTGNNLGKRYIVKEDREDTVFAHYFVRWQPILVNPYYIYYVTHSSVYDYFINGHKLGSSQPNLKVTDLKRFPIPLCDLVTQNKIANILKSIDDKISINNKINNNLYEMCNVLYHQLLDDNESNIEYKTIGEIAKKVITGKTPSTKNKEYWGGNIPFITIPDMHNQVFTINTERYITKEGAKSLIPKNSISVSCIATVGLVSINDKDSQTNQQINSIVIENDYDLYYLFEFLTEQEQYMKSIAGGSTTYNINKNTFENIQVPYLNKELIIEYDKKVRPMFEKIKSNQISNDTLSQLRDILLPKLMNGEIDLDNIEI